jgi:hypothetical protein
VNIFSLFRRRRPAPQIKWRAQYHAQFPKAGDPLYHFGYHRIGTFEIFEDGDNVLMLFPRGMGRPAEVFPSVAAAKAVAEALEAAA